MTAKKMKRVWLQNCYKDEPDKHERAYQKGFMIRLFNTAKPVEVGRPKKTNEYTSKQLQKMGLVGLYGWQFVYPIVKR